MIQHQPIENLTASELPIIIATVTDNQAVASVHVFYQNATSGTFRSMALSPVSGTDDYAAILEKQPEGNFTYCIEASDGTNIARSPVTGYHTVTVTDVSGNGWISTVLLVVVIILMLLAALLVYMHIRRKKSIK